MAEFKYIEEFDSYSTHNVIPDSFKEALYLSKGASNNKFAYEASLTGLPAPLIAEYFSNLSEWRNCPGNKIIKGNHHSTKYAKSSDRRAKQAYQRLVDVFDTPYGIRCKEKFGERSKNLIIGKNPRKGITIIPTSEDAVNRFNLVLSPMPTSTRSYWNNKVATPHEMYMPLVKALAGISDENVKKLKEKHIDVEAITGCVDKWAHNEEFLQDFAPTFAYDVNSFANIPQELLRDAKMLTIADDELTDVYNSRALAPYSASICSAVGQYYTYGANMQRYKYCSLLYRGLYDAMKELGVGIFPNQEFAFNVSSRSSRFNKISKKVIKLNEQYQKAIKAKNNTIEPALIRQTIVGMFNDYSKRNYLYYTMFEREDMPAPTLESMQPKKKSTKTASKSTKKSSNSTGRERARKPVKVVIDGVELTKF